MARLGQEAGIIGGVGQDDFGRCVLDRLNNDGVCCDYIRVTPGKSTAVAFIAQFHDGSRRFLFHLDGTAAVLEAGQIPRRLPAVDIFHLMGCSLSINEGFRAEIVRIAGELRRDGARISFDPNVRAELLGPGDLNRMVDPILAQCSVFLPGASELLMITDEDSQDRAVSKLFARYPMEVVVVKQGKEGCSVHTRETSFVVAAYSVDEVDATGAGDCFDAGFLCGLLENEPLAQCARMGAAAGALNAAAFGPMEGKISRQAVQGVDPGGRSNHHGRWLNWP